MKFKKFKHILKSERLFIIGDAYRELSEHKKAQLKEFPLREKELEVGYENFQTNEIMDLLLPQDVPR